MKILALESSALVASAAVIEDGIIKCEYTINNALTHSVTLLPMIDSMLALAGMDVKGMDAIALSAGPGSFTGLRIGAATAKGLGLSLNRPVIKVSTLDAMGLPLSGLSGAVICPVMDARRGQVYCAAYRCGMEVLKKAACDIHLFTGKLKGLAEGAGGPYAAAGPENMEGAEQTPGPGKPEAFHFIFTGDGAVVNGGVLKEELAGLSFSFAKAPFNRQRAAYVAQLGESLYMSWLNKNSLTAEMVSAAGADSFTCFDKTVMNSDDITPEYLRKPQAEQAREAGTLEEAGLHSLKKMK